MRRREIAGEKKTKEFKARCNPRPITGKVEPPSLRIHRIGLVRKKGKSPLD